MKLVSETKFLMKGGQVVDVKFAPVSVNFTVSKGWGIVTAEVLAAVLIVPEAVELTLTLDADALAELLITGTCEAIVVSV
jgi:hypothetical protein